MTNLEALLTTATTLEQIEDRLIASDERDIRAAVHLARLEVARMVEEEVEKPGTHEGFGDGTGRSL